MKLTIYDPLPLTNDFLSIMYLRPLIAYARDRGISVDEGGTIEDIKDSVVLIHGDRLSLNAINVLKGNNNRIISFDINDSSYFSSQYHNSPESELIDLVFKISGIPKKNGTLDPNIDRHFNITSSQVNYLPEADWDRFVRVRPKMRSLPYVLWNPMNSPTYRVKSYSERNQKVIVRGGNHFWRVVLWLRLLDEGLDDLNCGFATEAYFSQGMEERFKYCQSCIEEKIQHGRTRYDTVHDHTKCKSPAFWGIEGEMYGGPQMGRNEFGHWNNRCPASFIWLAHEYERGSGRTLNHDTVERVLSGSNVGIGRFTEMLEGAGYAADYKWLNTIYAPPRFWEAAACGTVNMVAKRVADQSYFPVLNEGEHFITFPEDLSEFHLVGEAQWTNISKATKDLYETWIRGTQYKISTNLLKHIVDNIEEVCS